MFQWKPFIKNIAIIAIPVALQNLLSTTASMVDTMMLARLGEQTVGAVGLCAQFSSLIFASYWGFIGGGMLFFSQFWGAGDEDGITRSYGMTIIFLMLVAAVFSSLAFICPEFIMSVYTDKPAIQQIGVTYLRLVAIAYPMQILSIGVSALLRSIEKVKIPLYGGIASVLANCFFNYIFIFGKFGAPALGVRGAAIGTIIAAAVNLLILYGFVIIKKIPFVLQFSKHFRWKSGSFRIYLQKCFPVICNEMFIGIGGMLINIVLGRQSEQAIAAVAVFRTLEGVIIAFFSGFSNAASIVVGKEVGAGHHQTAYERAIRLVYLCSALIGMACLALIAVHNPLLHAMGLSGESYRIGTNMLLIFSVVALIRMGNWAQNDTYRSAGDAAFGSIMEITFMFLMVIPCVYLANFVFHAPFLLVFTFCYIDEPVRYFIMQRHMYSGKWIKPVSDEGLAAIDSFREQLNRKRHKK